MKLLRAWLGALPGYLWSGWGAIASLLLGRENRSVKEA